MAAHGRLLPVTIRIPSTLDRLLIGESGHRNFDAKPRAYEFASGCLGSFPDSHERPLLPLLAVNIWVYVAGARLTGALD